MKRSGILFLSAFLVLLSACKPQEIKASPSPAPISIPAPMPTPAPAEPLEIQDAFKAVLSGEMEFYHVGTDEYLDITRLRETVTSEDLPVIAKQFAVVDLDDDDSPEVILWLAMEGGGNDYVGFVILRYREGDMYGYTLWHRAFEDLKADGTFLFSGGASNWGVGTISFSEDGYEVDKITYCESSFDAGNTLHESYYVDHKRATAEEFEAAIDERAEREDAQWYDVTDDNIEAGLVKASASSEEETARAAYMALLSGNTSLWDDDLEVLQQGCFAFYANENKLEYTMLDLDGDGFSELLMQCIDDPGSYNAVFHYDKESGRLFCWNYDAMETSCRDYPLEDGTMVRQYDFFIPPGSEVQSYTVFRYRSNGEHEELLSMFARDEFDGQTHRQTYSIDGENVDEADFGVRFEESIGLQRLDRAVWTMVA